MGHRPSEEIDGGGYGVSHSLSKQHTCPEIVLIRFRARCPCVAERCGPPITDRKLQGAGNGAIPPNQTLSFVVDLLGAKPAPQAKIEDTQVGAGAEAKNGDTVSVNYTGKLEDGTVFDSSVGKQPLDFVLGTHQVIPGMEQGVLGMKVGGKRTITIPPELAYGAQGAGNGVIPPNATLIFDVELVAIK